MRGSTGLFGIVAFLLPLCLVGYAFKRSVGKRDAEVTLLKNLLSALHGGSAMLTDRLDAQLVLGRVKDLMVQTLAIPNGAVFGLEQGTLRCLGAWRNGRDCNDSEIAAIAAACGQSVGGSGTGHIRIAGESWCVLPLVTNASPVGLLCLSGAALRLRRSAEVFEAFAAQVAAALAIGRLYEETRTLALTDALTGLASQRSMRDQLGALLERARTAGTSLSLVTLDLDKFKQINDRFGHPVGDRAIREVANIIRSRMGPEDVAARNGGDEFTLLLPGRQPEEARALMEGLADAVADTELLNGKQRIPLTLSVGIATFPDHAGALPALISRSDQATYIAKHIGRNRVTVWGDLSGIEDQLGHHWGWAPEEKRDSPGQLADPIKVMTAMVDARDGLTYGHSVRVEKYCAAVARVQGLSEQAVADISLGGLLHDVGKIGIPDAILNKPGPLTLPETETVQQHPEIGAELMRRIGMPEELVAMVLHHHEFFDGSGYPFGLSGRDIPLGARIIAVCDAFEAITSRRPYNLPKPVPWAVEELRRCGGIQFDPEIVGAFVNRVLAEDATVKAAAVAAGRRTVRTGPACT